MFTSLIPAKDRLNELSGRRSAAQASARPTTVGNYKPPHRKQAALTLQSPPPLLLPPPPNKIALSETEEGSRRVETGL